MNDKLKDLLVPVAAGTGAYLVTNNNVLAGVLTAGAIYMYYSYSKPACTACSPDDNNQSVNSTSLDPLKIEVPNNVMRFAAFY